MTLASQALEDNEGRRLLAVYEASRVRENAATKELLLTPRTLRLQAYLELVSNLRTLRTECSDKKLALGAHRKKMQDHLIGLNNS